jgi:hypothetical protein
MVWCTKKKVVYELFKSTTYGLMYKMALSK